MTVDNAFYFNVCGRSTKSLAAPLGVECGMEPPRKSEPPRKTPGRASPPWSDLCIALSLGTYVVLDKAELVVKRCLLLRIMFNVVTARHAGST